MTDQATQGVEITMDQLVSWLNSTADFTGLPIVATKPLAGVLYHWARSMKANTDPVAEGLRKSVKKYLDAYDDPDDFGTELGKIDLDFEVQCAAFQLEGFLSDAKGYTWPIYDGPHPTIFQTRGTALGAEASLLKLSETLLTLAKTDKRIRRTVADAARNLVATIRVQGNSVDDSVEAFEAGLSFSLSKGVGQKEARDGRARGALTSDNLGLVIAVLAVQGASTDDVSQKKATDILHRILPKVDITLPGYEGLQVKLSKAKRTLQDVLGGGLSELQGRHISDEASLRLDPHRVSSTYARIADELPGSTTLRLPRFPTD